MSLLRRPVRPLARRTAALAALISVAAVTACAPGGADSKTAGGGAATSAGGNDRASRALPAVQRVTPALTAKDPKGREITVPAAPTRIVCLTGLCDDITASLGITPIATATPRLAVQAVEFGDAGKSIPVVPGSFGSEDVSAIAAHKPDLVIGLAGAHDSLVAGVSKFAPMMTISTRSDEESIGYLRTVATLTGKADEAEKAEKDYWATIDKARKKIASGPAKDRRVLTMWGSASGQGVHTTSSPMGSAMARVFDYPFGSIGDDPLKEGAYSVEQLLEKDPEVIFMASMTFKDNDKKATEVLAANPVWKQLTAVKKGNVHEVDKEVWAICRGIRCLGAMVDQAVGPVESAK